MTPPAHPPAHAPTVHVPPAPGDAWRTALTRLAWIGPILFSLTTEILIRAQAGFLSQFGNLEDEFPISANALGPYGGVMVANFLMMGASVLALAWLLRRATPRNVATRLGVALVALAGVALAAEAAPMEFPPATTWHGKLHFAAFFVWALSLFAAYLALGVGLLQDPVWRRHGVYTLAVAVVSVALILTAPWATSDVVTRHGAWWGPLGRAHFIVWATWFTVMARKAAAVGRVAERGSGRTGSG